MLSSRKMIRFIRCLERNQTILSRHLSLSVQASSGPALCMDTVNPNLKEMQFAVRGPIVIRGEQLEKDLKNGVQKPFASIVKANIGDAHDMGQKPITFIRQVLACTAYPILLQTAKIPTDVKERVNLILNDCGGKSIGAYTKSAGIDCIRKHCAEYIARRDGISSDPDNIILTNGATEGIRNVLKLFVNQNAPRKTGVMIPIPQYPLYTATLEELGLTPIKYYLDEENGWSLNIEECERAYQEQKATHDIRAICIINPGNPTGQVLTRRNIEEIVRFAAKHNLFIMADEVYQDNIHDENSEIFSFKKVMYDMGGEYKRQGLASFYSVSKGYMGECGVRAGYTEFVNVDTDIVKLVIKMVSSKLCAASLGQVALDCAVCPPKPNDPSYERWLEEKTTIMNGMKERARLVQEAYGALDGISCNPVQGAMYAFPRLRLSENAINAARSHNVEPDFYYCMRMLEETGICTVPGSGFGQKDGTYHFRTTILPQTNLMKDMLLRFKPFHSNFMNEFQ